MMRAGRRKGATALEFTLAGIPVMFILFSIFEAARGMWTYEMMAYAVREGTRYASMHGKGCASPNTCQVTVGEIASYVQSAGPLLSSNTILTLTPASGSATSGTISSLSSSTTTWPPSTANAEGQTVTISAKVAFQTILAVFWTDAGKPVNDSKTFYLSATSAEPIQF